MTASGNGSAKVFCALAAACAVAAEAAPEPRVDRRRALGDALKELDALVGLAPVKAEVRKLASFIEIQGKRREAGLKNAPVSYHCVFTGNPGTGKTTVAPLTAETLTELTLHDLGFECEG